MFLNELTPLFKQFAQQPLSFTGGFFSGMFRLNLAEEPLKSWIEKQGIVLSNASSVSDINGRSNQPQSITIE